MTTTPKPRDVSPEEYGGAGAPAKNSDLALYSLIAGILSWVIFWFVGAVAAIVMGHMALREIRDGAGRIGGRGMAVAGLVLGYVQIGGLVLFLIFGLIGAGLFLSMGRVEVSDDNVRVHGPGQTGVEVSGDEERVKVTAPGTTVEVDGERVTVTGPDGRRFEVEDREPRTGREGKARADLDRISKALVAYWMDAGQLPGEEGLDALLGRPGGMSEETWKGPYLDALPVDPWGRPYRYRAPATAGERFVLFSTGADGVESADDVR